MTFDEAEARAIVEHRVGDGVIRAADVEHLISEIAAALACRSRGRDAATPPTWMSSPADEEDARKVWRRVAHDHGAGDFAGKWTGTLLREIAAALAHRSQERQTAEAYADQLAAVVVAARALVPTAERLLDDYGDVIVTRSDRMGFIPKFCELRNALAAFDAEAPR